MVLHDPLCSEEYSAGLQQGAFLNKHRLRVDDSYFVTLEGARTKTEPSQSKYMLNCRALSMAYVAAGKLRETIVARHSPPSWEPMLLFLSEARVRVIQ